MDERKPVRSCIACRRKGAKGELIKLARTPSGVVVDYGEKLPGRGAYVCAEPSCIRGALEEKALSRAFKEKTAPPAIEAIIAEIVLGAGRRLSSLLGMARKSGRAAWGFDAALGAYRKGPGGLMVVARDISENTLGKLTKEVPTAAARAVRFSTRDELGRLIGTAPVAVVYVIDRKIAEAIELEAGRLKAINRG